MARRNGANMKMDNVQTLQIIFHDIGKSFQPKEDPIQALADEIEKCRRKIWQCVGTEQQLQVGSKGTNALSDTKHAESNVSSAPSVKAYQSPKKGGNSRANIEFRVNAMKVVELRKELKSRGFDSNGLKKDLRARLLGAMMEESETQQLEMDVEPIKLDSPKPNMKANFEVKSPMVVDLVDSIDGDAPMADSSTEQVAKDERMTVEDSHHQTFKAKPAKISCSSTQAESGDAPKKNPVQEDSADTKSYWKNLSKPSSAPNALVQSPPVPSSSKKTAQSPYRSVVKNAPKTFGTSPANASSQIPFALTKTAGFDIKPEDDISPPSSEVSAATTTTSACSKISGARVRELVSKISGTSSNYSSSSNAQNGGSTSALSKNLQAKKEARLARMAEIRGKSKPLVTAKAVLAPKEYTAASSCLNKTLVSTNGKKNLAQQMREKALRKEKAGVQSSAFRKENIPASQSILSSTGKRNLPMSHDIVQDSLGGTLKQGFSMKKAKVASPLETYEISDREDSDTDDSDSENEKKKKKIPGWAKKDKLLPALEAQYNGCVAGTRVDPDELFPEVQSCDLEAIFGKNPSKAKYRGRTSSGNWTNDKVTVAEKLVYKRKMGFATKASEA